MARASDGQTALVLDRTAFYPTSGGQPHDVGSFHDVRVLDVIDIDDDRILHVVDRAPSRTCQHLSRESVVSAGSVLAACCR